MLVSLSLLSFLVAQAPAPKPFEFKDGDRVVWIGNTFVEREQRYGDWEAALIAANADKKITVRNLGWSGDTVFGDARAAFDNASKGFERLVSLTLELKPTVIFVAYGNNEAFEGKEGLEKFEKGLEKLLDALKPANARIVLFTPMPYEGTSHLLDANGHNQRLTPYADIIRKVANTRKLYLADLYSKTNELYKHRSQSRDMRTLPEITENGLHLNRDGYEATPYVFLESLGVQSQPAVIGTEDFNKLRGAVVEKNQLFFYRWRPQNETYLFGFRKHEQGKNAKEVAEFDPLIGKAEEEIDMLRKKFK
jgi:lysophospholipase L1-like esterase